MMATKEMNRVERIAAAKAQGASIKRVGLIMNLIVVAVLAVAAFGVYSIVRLVKDESRLPVSTTQE